MSDRIELLQRLADGTPFPAEAEAAKHKIAQLRRKSPRRPAAKKGDFAFDETLRPSDKRTFLMWDASKGEWVDAGGELRA